MPDIFRDDRGANEIIGFVLVFSLVVSAVGIVSVFGFQSLEDTRDSEEVNNAQRAFDVLADNLADIHQRGAPSRATEISLEDAQLQVGEPVNVTVVGVNPSSADAVSVFSYNPIVFEGRTDSKVVYSNGAVFLDTPEGGVMLQEPPVVIKPGRLAFPIIQTTPSGGITSTGGQTVRVRADQRQRQPLRGFTSPNTDYSEIRFIITSPRSDLWNEFLEEQGLSCTVDSPTKIDCSATNPEAVAISRTLIGYTFET